LRNVRPAAGGAAKPADDIPIAQRDRYIPPAVPNNVTTVTVLRQKQRFLLSGMIAALIGLAVVSAVLIKNSQSVSVTASQPVATESADTLLNHFRYEEAPTSELVTIGNGYRLRPAAAQKFQAMIRAAQVAGVNITTISAFRSVADQKRLFFDVKAERAQEAEKRAEVSAPPHYSEHHTGYAVDLGDAAMPGANLNQSFDQTAAFKWLSANAARYSFELSFRQNNAQGVSYEPWHWRYIGDSDSLETFYKAKKAQS
jgi:zinc D-Ala-D-Ala carboxypeptidase